MNLTNTTIKWIVWIVLSTIAGAWLGYTMMSDTSDKTLFMPGRLSAGHHQLGEACEACHTDAFGGGEVLQKACVECHGEQRVKPFDSHPAKKFKDPRNAELLENINALQCISCHTEHKPEITLKDGLTQPSDVCFHCHKDIAKERPSHEGMGFETCKNSGCHNFHNNRSLYTNFLIKHLDEPNMLERKFVPEKEFASLVDEVVGYPHDKYPVKQLTEDDIDAVERLSVNNEIKRDWLETAHARSGVNCSGCHVVENEGNQKLWIDHPDHKVCETCHSVENKRFMEGKHGMRLKYGLSPMTPGQAKLPMKESASHKELTCISCHGAHRFDVQMAAVDSCMRCHDDEHSKRYKMSSHAELRQKEVAGVASVGSGVSCATCHMPRINYDVSEWSSRIIVDHNQSANLSPNSKMIRSSCLHCHGLEFSIDALADEELIKNNFSGSPNVHVETMDLADRENKRREKKAAENNDSDMFGF